MRKNDIRGGTREWSKNLWEHIKALFSGLDTRVTALEQGGGGGGAVSGVKGDAESTYRTGNVNLTPANLSAKATQSAVSDPTASGTGLTFIDSITQDDQGVITPTKKTVQTATQSADGVMSSTDKAKLDGIAAGAEVNPQIANNLITTTPGSVLDAMQGKALKDAVDKLEALVIALPSPITFGSWLTSSTVAAIANVEDDMVVVEAVLGTPSAQTTDWTVTCDAAKLKIDGQSGTATTTATLYLMKSR